MRVTKPDEIKDLPEIKKIIWVPIASAFACSVFKTWLINISAPIFLLIAKDQHDRNLALDRANRSATALYKWFYYFTCSCTGYYLMKENILPWYLGGSGSLDAVFENVPF